MDDTNRIEWLWRLFNAKFASPAEIDELFAALSRPEMEEENRRVLQQLIAETPPQINDEERWQEIIEGILGRQAPARRLVRPIRWVAAASVAALLGVASYFYITRKPIPTHATLAATQDMTAPAANRARITLSGGQSVYLDSSANGTLATEAGTKLIKLDDGQLAYQGRTQGRGAAIYNTLVNPRGSRTVTLTLGDGTRVWLNAESTLRYPIAFGGERRIVTVSGEAYFEISPDKSRPFIVQKDDIQIRVLGTSFNIKAYPDEKDTRITLVDGAIQVKASHAGETRTLRPGQQARIVTGTIDVSTCGDMDAVTAWKNGYFYFNAQPIPEIMAELGRWYDATAVYQNDLANLSFSGRIRRDNNLSSVLKLFEATGNVHFRIDDKKIIIMK